MADERRVHRTDDVAGLLALVVPLEPHTTLIAGELSVRGLGLNDRAWWVEGADGGPGGLVVVSRLCIDRWYAKPLLLDPGAAPAIARLIDRSPARGVFGPDEHVAPVAAHLRRAGRGRTMPWSWVPPPLPPPEGTLDPRTRLATTDDLDALVGLYQRFELDHLSRRQLRRVLQRILLHGIIVVAEDRQGLVAAMRAECRSQRYAYWGGLTVAPEARNRGLARAVILRTHAATRALGLGYMVVRATGRAPRPGRTAAFNPLLQRPEYRELAATGTWATVNLRPRPPRRALSHLRRRAPLGRSG